MNATAARHLWSLEDWDAMIASGLIGPDDRVELIEGEVLEMTPGGDDHAALATCLTTLFSRLAGVGRAAIASQNPVRIVPRSEPEPDLVLLRWRDDCYNRRKPRGEDVLLVIEISDSTLGYDLGTKAALYARAGIPEMWVIDVQSERVHVLRRPIDGAYADARIISSGAFSPEVFPDFELTVSALFPPA